MNVACNSERAFTDFTYIARSIMVGSNAILYLPNYYYMRPIAKHHYKPIGKVINIGCFGAIRPLKNHINQAIAAIQLSNEIKVDRSEEHTSELQSPIHLVCRLLLEIGRAHV